MKFLFLNYKPLEESDEQDIIIVNPQHIAYIERAVENPQYTVLTMSSGDCILSTESIEEISSMV